MRTFCPGQQGVVHRQLGLSHPRRARVPSDSNLKVKSSVNNLEQHLNLLITCAASNGLVSLQASPRVRFHKSHRADKPSFQKSSCRRRLTGSQESHNSCLYFTSRLASVFPPGFGVGVSEVMPKVSSVTVYPVKGLKGIALQQAKVTRTGNSSGSLQFADSNCTSQEEGFRHQK